MDVLWTNLIAGDKDAYAQLYGPLYNRFYNYGTKFTEDIGLVEDAIQEVLLTVWTRRHQLSHITNPELYFLSSFRNLLFKKIKKVEHHLQVEQAGEWEPVFSADSIIISNELSPDELRQKLKNAINSLTPRQREAIFLRFYEGLSYQEVADTLDISVKACYKIVARALVQLKDNISFPILCALFLLK